MIVCASAATCGTGFSSGLRRRTTPAQRHSRPSQQKRYEAALLERTHAGCLSLITDHASLMARGGVDPFLSMRSSADAGAAIAEQRALLFIDAEGQAEQQKGDALLGT